jgi:hypothetical protein
MWAFSTTEAHCDAEGADDVFTVAMLDDRAMGFGGITKVNGSGYSTS